MKRVRRKPAPSKRPKIAPPDVRLEPFVRVIFSDAPKPPGFYDEYHAALDASHAGENRHRNRAAPHDWQSVYDLIVAADRDVFTRPIKETRVRAALATLAQTDEVKLAHGVRYSAFIKWARRGLKNKTLRLPPPSPPSPPPSPPSPPPSIPEPWWADSDDM